MSDVSTGSATGAAKDARPSAATVASTDAKPDAAVVLSGHALCKVYRSGEVEVHEPSPAVVGSRVA